MTTTQNTAPVRAADGARATVTDFNDAMRTRGADAVRGSIEAAINADMPAGPFRVDKRGVWALGTGDGPRGADVWVCAPLQVLALTRDRQNQDWGKLLAWKDADGNEHRHAVAAPLLVGDGRDLARLLAAGGLHVSAAPGTLQRLLHFVSAQAPAERARSVVAPGWHDGLYVLPNGETIGDAASRGTLVYQHTGGLSLAYAQEGDWKAQVAPLCVGNPNLVLAVCAPLAGPLLRMAGIGGGGFHFVGDSSTGKSTLLRVAASVAGSPELVREWRATANGLEGVAVLHNDATIIMDELAQIDAQQVGEAAYLLANGTGKSRSNRNGDARAAAQWQTLILSAGEIGLVQHMAAANKRARAGQTVRLVDLPADAGKGQGAFETVHVVRTAAEFSALLKERTAEHYGSQWRPWLEHLAAQLPASLKDAIKHQARRLRRELPEKPDGQVERVIDRFALLAAAGELATSAGITGWPEGEAERAISTCVRAWLRVRGGIGNADTEALLSQVRAFFESYGESRFDSLHHPHEKPVPNRAGFKRRAPDHPGGDLQYLVLPQVMKGELVTGYSPHAAKRWLINAGWLVPDAQGKRTSSRVAVPGMGRPEVYVFNAAAVHGGNDDQTQE